MNMTVTKIRSILNGKISIIEYDKISLVAKIPETESATNATAIYWNFIAIICFEIKYFQPNRRTFEYLGCSAPTIHLIWTSPIQYRLNIFLLCYQLPNLSAAGKESEKSWCSMVGHQKKSVTFPVRQTIRNSKILEAMPADNHIITAIN